MPNLLYVYPLRGNQEVGDIVEDMTAARNGWPDRYGVVQEVDGSQVKVKYESGNTRWKMHISIKKVLKASSVGASTAYKCPGCAQSHAIEGHHTMPTHECPYCGQPADLVN